jgi:hypothetical protein
MRREFSGRESQRFLLGGGGALIARVRVFQVSGVRCQVSGNSSTMPFPET